MVSQIQIDVKDVRSVYSGRPGCCCGCRGKHTYSSAHRAEAQENRGYEITDDEVNDKVVKLHVSRINKAIAAGDPGVEFDENYACLETPTRWWIVYYTRSHLVHRHTIEILANKENWTLVPEGDDSCSEF